MNVLFSSKEYDFHTLIKVAEIAGLAGVVSFHQAGDDYLVTFPDVEKTEEIVKDYRTRLRDLENNIWSDRKSTRLNSSHVRKSRMPSSA